MIADKIKNLNMLEMYPSIKDDFKTAIDYIDSNNITDGFFRLRRALEGICELLIKNDIWYIQKIRNKENVSLEEIIKRLQITRKITSEQASIFDSIRPIANRYIHGSEKESKYKQDLESLKNFCIRLDRQLPSIIESIKNNKNVQAENTTKSRTRRTTSSFRKRNTTNSENTFKGDIARSYTNLNNSYVHTNKYRIFIKIGIFIVICFLIYLFILPKSIKSKIRNIFTHEEEIRLAEEQAMLEELRQKEEEERRIAEETKEALISETKSFDINPISGRGNIVLPDVYIGKDQCGYSAVDIKYIENGSPKTIRKYIYYKPTESLVGDEAVEFINRITPIFKEEFARDGWSRNTDVYDYVVIKISVDVSELFNATSDINSLAGTEMQKYYLGPNDNNNWKTVDSMYKAGAYDYSFVGIHDRSLSLYPMYVICIMEKGYSNYSLDYNVIYSDMQNYSITDNLCELKRFYLWDDYTMNISNLLN